MSRVLSIVCILISFSANAQGTLEKRPWELDCDTLYLYIDTPVFNDCLGLEYEIADSILTNLDVAITDYFEREIKKEKAYLEKKENASNAILEGVIRSRNSYQHSQKSFIEYRSSLAQFVYDQHFSSPGPRNRQVTSHMLFLTIERIFTLESIKEEMLW